MTPDDKVHDWSMLLASYEDIFFDLWHLGTCKKLYWQKSI